MRPAPTPNNPRFQPDPAASVHLHPGGLSLSKSSPSLASLLPVPTLLLFLLLLVGTSCIPTESSADLVIVNGQEPESLDPAMVTGQSDLRIAGALFEGLTRYNPETALPEPGLAESWDRSANGRVYTFHIRPDAKWSTGGAITARDVVASWRRLLKPETGADYAGHLFHIKNAEAYLQGTINDFSQVGIKALDEHTLRVELESPAPFFLELCAFPTLAVVPTDTIREHGDHWIMQKPLPASGAFELEHWQLNDKVRLRKNTRYWDAANTRSEIIDLIPCTSAATALNLYLSGEVDVVLDKELVPVELLDTLRNRPDFHTYQFLSTYFLRINVTREPFQDPRVRQALAMAVDRDRLVTRITKGGEKVARHLVPPGLPDYESPPGLRHDPEQARRLLAEAGYPDGKGFPKIQYLFNNMSVHQKIAVELQEMWRKELGIALELHKMEWKVFLNAQQNLEYDLSRSSWIGDYMDPNTFLEVFTTDNGNNRTGWSNASYDELIARANRTVDTSRRAELFRQAEQILVEQQLPIIPIYFYVGLEYYDPERIQGIHQNLRAEHPLRQIHHSSPSPPKNLEPRTDN